MQNNQLTAALGERERKNELLGRQLVQLERGQELVPEAERGARENQGACNRLQVK